MTPHEYANLFPMMEDADLQRIVDDIKENGLNDDIITHQGKILDGRNRFKACEIAGVNPRFTEYDGKDALAFVVSHNLHRRHLTESQRAVVAAKWAGLKVGQPKKTTESIPPIGGISQPAPTATATRNEAGKLLNVGTSSIDRAKKVIKQSPHLIDKIEKGEMSVNAAYVITKAKPEPETLVIDGTTPTKRLPKYVHDDADRLWSLAKTTLEKIIPQDKSRERVLKAIIEYAQKRLTENK